MTHCNTSQAPQLTKLTTTNTEPVQPPTVFPSGPNVCPNLRNSEGENIQTNRSCLSSVLEQADKNSPSGLLDTSTHARSSVASAIPVIDAHANRVRTKQCTMLIGDSNVKRLFPVLKNRATSDSTRNLKIIAYSGAKLSYLSRRIPQLISKLKFEENYSLFDIIIHCGTVDICNSDEQEMTNKFAHLVQEILASKSSSVNVKLSICTIPMNYSNPWVGNLIHLVNSNLLNSKSTDYSVIDVTFVSYRYPKSFLSGDGVHYNRAGSVALGRVLTSHISRRVIPNNSLPSRQVFRRVSYLKPIR
jgi:hypothetical protein